MASLTKLPQLAYATESTFPKGGIRMNTPSQSYSIVGGPSKDLLFDACKYAHSKNVGVPLDFHVALAFTAPLNDPGCAYIKMALKDVVVTGISHEDGSGESFIIEGHCAADLHSFGSIAEYVYEHYRFKAYYNTHRRKGTFTIVL